MLEIAIQDSSGKEVRKAELDERPLGATVRAKTMHDAVVMYQANKRRGTHAARGRGEVAGSNKKPYRQKGTGRARAGSRKSPIWRSGGTIHGPHPRDYTYSIPRKARQAAVKSAMLAKLQDGGVAVVDEFNLTAVKTKDMVSILNNLGLAGRSALVVSEQEDRNLYLSSRNIPGVTVVPVRQLNAHDVLRHHRVLISWKALEKFCQPRKGSNASSKGEEG